jgi:hypothetical protein
MKVHPLADIFPPMTTEEFEALKADIKEHGVREPIWTYEDQIIDGRHRYRACEEIDIYCPSEEYLGDDPIAFVVSMNAHRRHLTPSQRAMIGAKAREHYDKLAKERQKQSGKVHGRGKEKVVETVSQPIDSGRARDLAGQAVGVSGPLVDRATKVLKQAEPEVAKAVEEGRLSVTKAAVIADEPPEVQRWAAENATINGGCYRNGRYEKPTKDEPTKAEPTERQRDNAFNYANDAINALRKIGRDNPLRAEAFKIVKKWIKDNP